MPQAAQAEKHAVFSVRTVRNASLRGLLAGLACSAAVTVAALASGVFGVLGARAPILGFFIGLAALPIAFLEFRHAREASPPSIGRRGCVAGIAWVLALILGFLAQGQTRYLLALLEGNGLVDGLQVAGTYLSDQITGPTAYLVGVRGTYALSFAVALFLRLSTFRFWVEWLSALTLCGALTAALLAVCGITPLGNPTGNVALPAATATGAILPLIYRLADKLTPIEPVDGQPTGE